ncbi:MAG: hypothetical protein GF401_14655 [Chitinivibrionales bacterium]|nr:hypothetical protein [Chitinivibrionales bacterium]
MPSGHKECSLAIDGKGSRMKVLIITEEDVFYIYEFFKHFFPLARKADYTVSGITILPPFNKRSTAALAKQMYGFYGLFNFLRMGSLYAFRKFAGFSVEQLAKKYGIPSLDTQNVNDPAYIEKVRENRIDCIVSIAAPQIFKGPLLDSVPKGCINSHSALLPENKGMMPVFWGMYSGNPYIGVTIHYMDKKLDSGDIVKQKKVEVGNESLHEMIIKTKRLSAHLIDESLREIMAGRVQRSPMPQGGSYHSFPTPQEVKEFKRRGKRIL